MLNHNSFIWPEDWPFEDWHHGHPHGIGVVISVRRKVHHHQHHRRWRVVQIIHLEPGENTMAAPVMVSIGHQVQASIEYLDQNNNPMQTTPVPDAPPSWVDAQSPAGDMTL